MRFFRSLFPGVVVRRAWTLDGTPVWEFRFTSRPLQISVLDTSAGPTAIRDGRDPVRFVSSRGVEIGGDTLWIEQFHHRIRKPVDGLADQLLGEQVESPDVAAALVELAADPDNESKQHLVVARLAWCDIWFRSAQVLDISATRITGAGLGRLLNNLFVWRAEGGHNLTYLVAPDPDTKELLAADPDLVQALIRAACPRPDAALGELESSLREALTRLGVAAAQLPVTRVRETWPAGLVLAVDPDLPVHVDLRDPPDRPKSESERALSEELAELARKVGTASVRGTDPSSKAG